MYLIFLTRLRIEHKIELALDRKRDSVGFVRLVNDEALKWFNGIWDLLEWGKKSKTFM